MIRKNLKAHGKCNYVQKAIISITLIYKYSKNFYATYLLSVYTQLLDDHMTNVQCTGIHQFEHMYRYSYRHFIFPSVTVMLMLLLV